MGDSLDGGDDVAFTEPGPGEVMAARLHPAGDGQRLFHLGDFVSLLTDLWATTALTSSVEAFFWASSEDRPSQSGQPGQGIGPIRREIMDRAALSSGLGQRIRQFRDGRGEKDAGAAALSLIAGSSPIQMTSSSVMSSPKTVSVPASTSMTAASPGVFSPKSRGRSILPEGVGVGRVVHRALLVAQEGASPDLRVFLRRVLLWI